MKTLLRILLVFLLTSYSVTAQIPNPSFELWTNSLPIDWTINSIPPLLLPVTQSTDAYSGLFAIKGQVVNSSGSPFTPSISAVGTSGTGFPFTQSYSALSGWYKANMIGADIGVVEIVIYDITSTPIGSAFGPIPSSSNYQQFTVPISYSGTTQPATATIYFSIVDTSGTTSGSIGSEFLIDDLSFTPASSVGAVYPNTALTIFPNPVSEKVNLNGNFSSNHPYNVKIFDCGGKMILKTSVCSLSSSSLQPLDVSYLAVGNYLVVISDFNYSSIQRFTINR